MRNLTRQEAIDVCKYAMKKFNEACMCGFVHGYKESDSGVGTEFEKYFLIALNHVTGKPWYKGDKDTEQDFKNSSGDYNPIELKTTIRGSFTGGTTGGRIAKIEHDKDKCKKYTNDPNDKSKIYIYDYEQYIFISIDRPWNGWDNYHINKVEHGNIREVDWNTSRGLNPDARKKLDIIIDESNSLERRSRCPWQTQNRKKFTKNDLIKYAIGETINNADLNIIQQLIDEQRQINDRTLVMGYLNNLSIEQQQIAYDILHKKLKQNK